MCISRFFSAFVILILTFFSSCSLCPAQLSPSLLARLFSAPPGPSVSIDNTSSVLSSKTSILDVGMISLLPGGTEGYWLPNVPGDPVSSMWCVVGGTKMAIMDTNANPDILPKHRLQLVYADDGYDPAKAFTTANEMFSYQNPQTGKPISLMMGSISIDTATSAASVARFMNKPYLGIFGDSTLIPETAFPTYVSHWTSFEAVGAALAEFCLSQGWKKIATLTSLSVQQVSAASHFASAATRLGISISSREAYDTSESSNQFADTGGFIVDSASSDQHSPLNSVVQRLKQSDVRIIYIGCETANVPSIFKALDDHGMIGPKYAYLGHYTCIGGNPDLLESLHPRMASWVRGVITAFENTHIPDQLAPYQAFTQRLTERYKADPTSLFNCDPIANPISTSYLVGTYQLFMTGINALHRLESIKEECLLPINQALLNQTMPMSLVTNITASSGAFSCESAMAGTSWNTELAIQCCLLDPERSPYVRRPDPFGFGAYSGGDGPVLLQILKSIDFVSVMGSRVGAQSPERPIVNVIFSNLFYNETSKALSRQFIAKYTHTAYNVTSKEYKWQKTRLAQPLFFDGTTTIPDDGVIRSIQVENASQGGRGLFTALAAIGIVLIWIGSYFVWKHRDVRSIKSSSVTFMMLIMGGAVFALSTIFTLFQDNDATCVARVWLGYLSFSLLFGSLLLKTYRLARIFDNRVLRVTTLSDANLLQKLAIYVTAVIAILISWMVRHAPHLTFKLSTDARSGYWTCQSDSYLEMWLLLGLHASALLWGIYLCVKSQAVFAELNESKQIALSIYNTAVLSGLVVGIDQGLDSRHVDVLFYIYSSGILLATIVTVGALLGPKLADIYKLRSKHKRSSNPSTLNQRATDPTTKHRNSSVTSHDARAPHEPSNSDRVSDLGLGMTQEDWMKLGVYVRKSADAVAQINVERLMLAHNHVHSLLLQIYQDASKPGTANADATTTTTEGTHGNHALNALGVPLQNDVPAPILGRLSVSATNSSDGILSTKVFDVNQRGIKMNLSAAAQLQQAQQLHQKINSQQTSTLSSKRDSIDHQVEIQLDDLDIQSAQSAGRLGVVPTLTSPPSTQCLIENRVRPTSGSVSLNSSSSVSGTRWHDAGTSLMNANRRTAGVGTEVGRSASIVEKTEDN